ncbi:MAG: succinyl-diaminopimelate desuccinylase [Alphaproteobacteria bacterium]|nr:succinyl-diaminopimelate desuccinylase [Alphaproteobacteria bacterium]MDE2335864.1 succinyl-diaminopimelate desuccinylase [Alphaproteobacteria bacterium]
MTDPVSIAQGLIRCRSVTPAEGGALDYLEKLLSANGFACHRVTFSDHGTPDVENLYARRGNSMPNLCFAGHTDVVPVGDAGAWTADPFGGEIRDGKLYGRGACDMKGAIAAFVAAACDVTETKGALSFLITGDEEGPSVNGTKKMLQWLAEKNEKIGYCIVGEPTSDKTLGDTIKIGRRGSLTGRLTVNGKQGHVAYPHLADNPVPKLLPLLDVLDGLILDAGTEHFQPSNLEIVDIDTGNKAENVIPAAARAVFNVRFNDLYSGAALEKKLRAAMNALDIPYELNVRVSGESFLTPAGKLSDALSAAVEKITGRKPVLGTGGGTSDARFIHKFCPVAELGLLNATAHQADEHVAAEDVRQLAEIYKAAIRALLS